MAKRLISMLLLTVLLVGALTACGDDGVISAKEAEKIVLKDLGVKASEVEMHMHPTSYGDTPCYGIYVTYKGEELTYIIHGITGEILEIAEGGHSH